MLFINGKSSELRFRLHRYTFIDFFATTELHIIIKENIAKGDDSKRDLEGASFVVTGMFIGNIPSWSIPLVSSGPKSNNWAASRIFCNM